jgi:hypothetical protein
MTLAEKLKKLLIRDIEEINSKCQIYYNPNTRSIWFINPETKFWYFEYSLDGDLWWRYTGFNIFKDLYRMDDKTFDDIISEWVEEALNCKVVGTLAMLNPPEGTVEETLNCKVLSTRFVNMDASLKVEEALNCKVLTTARAFTDSTLLVEETLKCKVITIEPYEPFNEVNTYKIINESQTI